MQRTKLTSLLSATLMAAGLLAGGAVLAGDRDEVMQFRQAPHDLSAAIVAAERAVKGRAVAAEFDFDSDDRDGGAYEVKVVADGILHKVTIDATSGAVRKSKEKGPLAEQDADDAIEPARLGAPLAELVQKAEQASGEKVMAIEYEFEKDRPVGIEVELGKADGSSPSFLLDAASGTLTPYKD